MTLQPKLLRVLQNGEFERIGGQQTLKVDVRVISATNRDLLKQIENHQFREDLFYRLNVFPITIPPLRNRREDISLLIAHFVKRFSEEHHKSIDSISKADMTRLTEYSWPGNVRELTNVIERSIISSPGNTLKLEWINGKSSNETNTSEPLSIEEIERAHFLKVLDSCRWKINGDNGAAAKLGLNPNTLRSRLKKLGIHRNDLGNTITH
jgi:formate hydrogenlyase transcriptional activator